MALKLTNYTTVYGIGAQHWVVDMINVNNKFKYAEITILGFYDEVTYLEGSAPLETKKVKINWNDGFEQLYSKKAKANSTVDIFETAYIYIKNNVELFKNAEDC